MLWEVDIHPAEGQLDLIARETVLGFKHSIARLGEYAAYQGAVHWIVLYVENLVRWWVHCVFLNIKSPQRALYGANSVQPTFAPHRL